MKSRVSESWLYAREMESGFAAISTVLTATRRTR